MSVLGQSDGPGSSCDDSVRAGPRATPRATTGGVAPTWPGMGKMTHYLRVTTKSEAERENGYKWKLWSHPLLDIGRLRLGRLLCSLVHSCDKEHPVPSVEATFDDEEFAYDLWFLQRMVEFCGSDKA